MTAPNISTSKPLPGVAVIRTGYWGKNLVRVHQRLGALKLICDKDETVLGRFKEIYPEVEVCLAVNDILEREDIQAVVTKNVLDHALMAGNPAPRTGWVCACGKRLEEDLACSVCGAEYRDEGAKGLAKIEERSGG